MVDNNYSLIPFEFALDTPVTLAWNTSSEVLTGALNISMTPAWGISSISIDAITLTGATTHFASISVDRALPATVINGDIVYFNTRYDNTYAHANSAIPVVAVQADVTGVALSAGAVGTVMADSNVVRGDTYLIALGYSTYTASPSFDAGVTVTYGASSTIIGGCSYTMTPSWGITSVNVTHIALSGDTTRFSAVSTLNRSLPAILASGDVINFATIYNNNYLHTGTITHTLSANIVATTTSANVSAGVVTTRVGDGSSNTGSTTLNALGDASVPGPVTSFAAVHGPSLIALSWVNPVDADFTGVYIQQSTTAYATTTADGTNVYLGAGTSVTVTGLAEATYYFTAFAYDNVGRVSTRAVVTESPLWNLWASEAEHARLYVQGQI